MSEIDDGERILNTLIAEAEDAGFLSKGEAQALNEDLRDVVYRLHDAYERGAGSRDEDH
jgi:hypothetical protein